MATEKWIAGSGQGLTYGAAFGAEINSIVNGNAILSSIVITNGTALDIFADVSVAMGSITIAAPNFLGIYLYPLNQDGSTYGDGRFGTSAAGPPGPQYYAGPPIVMPTGAAASEGTSRGIILPPGSFKFVLWNQLGATLAASGNTIAYRTYNRSVA